MTSRTNDSIAAELPNYRLQPTSFVGGGNGHTLAGRSMGNRDSELLTILRIGHETSIRGSGISLDQALQGSRYAELRPSFDADDLLPLIRAHNELVNQWMSSARISERMADGISYATDLSDGCRLRMPPCVSNRSSRRSPSTS